MRYCHEVDALPLRERPYIRSLLCELRERAYRPELQGSLRRPRERRRLARTIARLRARRATWKEIAERLNSGAEEEGWSADAARLFFTRWRRSHPA